MSKKLTRKDFLKLGAVSVGAAALTGIPRTVLADQPQAPKPKSKETDDILVRMLDDVNRALIKPKNERNWAMVIDIRKCIGCFACTISCIAENKLPPGVVYRPVIEEELGKYPNLTRRFWPKPCFHCDNPPCVPVCPVEATYKREDGIVVVDYDKCIGCRYCITACPYGARYSDFGEFYSSPVQPYEKLASYEYKKKWQRKAKKSPIGNARKCHFCIHLIEKGILPRCVSSCVGRATYFGDLNDKDSLVYKLNGSSNVVRLKEQQGTKPKVCYLI